MIYRFTAPLPVLHAHAKAEFAAHWDKPQTAVTPASSPPFTEKDIALITTGFGVTADWMVPPADAVGTMYMSADGQFSHRPAVFIDTKNSVLYFYMTD
jgi:hypothetical protein